MDEDGRQTGPPLRISDVSIYTQDVRIRLVVPDKMAFTERRVRQSESGRARSEGKKDEEIGRQDSYFRAFVSYIYADVCVCKFSCIYTYINTYICIRISIFLCACVSVSRGIYFRCVSH